MFGRNLRHVNKARIKRKIHYLEIFSNISNTCDSRDEKKEIEKERIQKDTLVGLLTLSENILINSEVVGKKYACEIAGLTGQIHFPQDSEYEKEFEIGLGYPMLPPTIGANWKRERKSIIWGYPMGYPKDRFSVDCLALSFKGEKENAQKLYNSINEWEQSFLSFLKLVTKQNIERGNLNSTRKCSLELMNERNYIPNQAIIKFDVYFSNAKSYATEENILNAITFANSGRELLLEYQMLLASYEALRHNQNRRAILDACSAFEIVLVKMINQHLSTNGISPEILENKYRTLGERHKYVMDKVDSSIEGYNCKDLVITPRNDLMHNKDVYPTDEKTDNLILCVEKVLKHYHKSYY